jgi:hypothetical protein
MNTGSIPKGREDEEIKGGSSSCFVVVVVVVAAVVVVVAVVVVLVAAAEYAGYLGGVAFWNATLISSKAIRVFGNRADPRCSPVR